jgi:hypothetical protein
MMLSGYVKLLKPQDLSRLSMFQIRLKRLAKLQGATTPGEPSSSSLPARPPKQPPPARVQPASPVPKRTIEHVATPQVVPKKKAPAKLNFEQWHHLTAGNIYNVTLDVWMLFLYRNNISYCYSEERGCAKWLRCCVAQASCR